MADKLMYIPIDDKQKSGLKVVVEMFEYSTYWMKQSKFTQVPKVVKQMNKKTLL